MRKEVNSEELYLSTNATDAEVGGAVKAEVASAEEKDRKCGKVSEILELRGKNKKVFRMSDGTEQAEFYPNVVHVLDEETGDYVELDNRLKLTDGGNYFCNKKGRFVAKFNRKEDKEELFTAENGAHKISFSVKSASGKSGKTIRVSEKPKAGFNGKSVAAFIDPDIVGVSFSGMDDVSTIEYAVTNDGVKENIIIYKQAPVYHYAFTLSCENVTAVFEEHSKRIAFTSNETEEEVFFIPVSFMKDADGEISYDVDYEVESIENGNIQLTITADSEWINAQEREFPVVIDSHIQVADDAKFSTFSWCGGYISNASTHKVGAASNGGDTCNANRMYMKIEIPTLPLNLRVKKAELIFTQSDTNTEGAACSKFGLFRVPDKVIVPGNLTPAHEAELIDCENIKLNCEVGECCIKYAFDITVLMEKLNKEGISSASLVLMMLDENVLCNQNITVYGSSTGTNAPYLVISYDSRCTVNASGSIDLA